MSAGTGRVPISRFFSDTEEWKQLLQETVILSVLEINWLAVSDTPFNSSKTTCSISARLCRVLKSKGTPLMLESLCFKVRWWTGGYVVPDDHNNVECCLLH